MKRNNAGRVQAAGRLAVVLMVGLLMAVAARAAAPAPEESSTVIMKIAGKRLADAWQKDKEKWSIWRYFDVVETDVCRLDSPEGSTQAGSTSSPQAGELVRVNPIDSRQMKDIIRARMGLKTVQSTSSASSGRARCWWWSRGGRMVDGPAEGGGERSTTRVQRPNERSLGAQYFRLGTQNRLDVLEMNVALFNGDAVLPGAGGDQQVA